MALTLLHPAPDPNPDPYQVPLKGASGRTFGVLLSVAPALPDPFVQVSQSVSQSVGQSVSQSVSESARPTPSCRSCAAPRGQLSSAHGSASAPSGCYRARASGLPGSAGRRVPSWLPAGSAKGRPR